MYYLAVEMLRKLLRQFRRVQLQEGRISRSSSAQFHAHSERLHDRGSSGAEGGSAHNLVQGHEAIVALCAIQGEFPRVNRRVRRHSIHARAARAARPTQLREQLYLRFETRVATKLHTWH